MPPTRGHGVTGHPGKGRIVHDDTYCLFVILACLTTLAVPDAGQVIVALLGFALAVLAQLTPEGNNTDPSGHRDRHVAGR